MPYTFTESAAKRIAAAVKRVERTPVDLRGEAAKSYEPGREFFAMLLGQDLSGRWTFVPVTPDPAQLNPDAFVPQGGDGIR